ncbi:MAG: peptidase [Pseudonocardiales bacterium]|nr:MAG: peptidase [Pseudonocardiales bacterium]
MSLRDRRGRGNRGALVPPSVPLARSRSQQFDDRVLAAVEELERRFADELSGVEFAVEEVPPVDPDDGAPEGLLADQGVPLSRLTPADRDRRGAQRPARIVVYRRPLELRAHDDEELDDVVREVVIEQVAALLGIDVDEVDPPRG